MSITKKLEWARRAMYTTAEGGSFTDKEFHAYLRQMGVQRETSPKRTEWHRFADLPKTSLEYFNDFTGHDFRDLQSQGEDDYVLRPEQLAAVELAIDNFRNGSDEVLWNAKPRFGKTLTTYDLMRKLGVKKALIVTNRPAIANSWYDDYIRFIGHQTTYAFVSESSSLSERTPMTRSQWTTHSAAQIDHDPRIIEFVSLQDLKGARYFGGQYDKLRHIADLQWDLLVIDEAHEGVDTFKTDVAFNQIRRKWTLHLSGTPFKALASGKFGGDQIFNWTYEDEQTARKNWADDSAENPYSALPTLNMLTYQVSRMISDQLTVGVAIAEDEANIDYAFDLGEFFSTKQNGFFEHEADVLKFLDCLTVNEKYPFSTPELRDEIRHSFWLLDRVASAKALEKLLKSHEVFGEYEVIVAAGDGRSDDDDPDASSESLERVRKAIAEAEQTGGKTITLSVGQLTTGVTVPEWTAVIMLSNMTSPSRYMQAAFRAQNPCMFERAGSVFQKQNAYIFDFAPERTLTIFDAFANNLSPTPAWDHEARRSNVGRLLNFFPVIGEDAEGRMVELDATQVLTFPQIFKAREVVRRGFLSNLLFANVSGIFRNLEQVKGILEKLPTAKQGKIKTGQTFELPEKTPTFDDDSNVKVDFEKVINPKIAELGKPVWSAADIDPIDYGAPYHTTAREVAKLVTERSRELREELKEAYDLTAKQVERDEKQTESAVIREVERALIERDISHKRFDDEIRVAATEAEAEAVEAKRAELDVDFQKDLLAIVTTTTVAIATDIVTREETKKEQKVASATMDDARSHLRGFARTIPMFLMAYGDRNVRLSNFDSYTPAYVFEEITGITIDEFKLLRDGQEVVEANGTVTSISGLFDESVFDQSIQEFLTKKETLADYFDDAQQENIFAYIPQQKTSLVFTPEAVVKMMVDTLEAENPGIFSDPAKTFADLFSTAGLFLMELVRRLDTGLAESIPDRDARLKHIFTSQVFEMSHNELLHRITIEAVSGGVPERKDWITNSGHFRVGNLAAMTEAERQHVIDDMLTGGAQS
ncbi:MAG: DEAD/DEAH box helicase family protein [Thermomicrobiales bacterium]|nr:DEAD/DEAH box helicase family protein [Thermomicrobiales bacterium]